MRPMTNSSRPNMPRRGRDRPGNRGHTRAASGERLGRTIVTGYLLDSHVWFWHLVGSDRLPEALRQEILALPEQCHLSPVSVWKIGMLSARGRLEVDGSYRDWVAAAYEFLPVKAAALNQEVALVSLEVELPRREHKRGFRLDKASG